MPEHSGYDGDVKECPFCLTPVGEEIVECPSCKNRLDVYRTGYYVRPDLSRPKTAVIWAVVLLVVGLLSAAFVRACAVASNSAARAAPTSHPAR